MGSSCDLPLRLRHHISDPMDHKHSFGCSRGGEGGIKLSSSFSIFLEPLEGNRNILGTK